MSRYGKHRVKLDKLNRLLEPLDRYYMTYDSVYAVSVK